MQKLILVVAAVMILSVPFARAQNNDSDGLDVGDWAEALEASEWVNAESDLDVPKFEELRGHTAAVQ